MARINLAGKTVVITGASGGIGSECAVAFAEKGARLVLSGRDREALEQTAARVRGIGSEAHVVPAEVKNHEEVRGLVERALELTGGLHVMLLGAGFGVLGRVESLSLESFREQMEVNFLGALSGFYAALPHFIRQGSGEFIILNSLSGRAALPYNAPYSASKFALWGFADCVRCELRRFNINLLSVYPYFVKTRFQGRIQSPDFQVPEDLPRKMLGQSPERLARRIVRACEKRKGELLCTPLGWIAPRFFAASYRLSEQFRRLSAPFIRKMLAEKRSAPANEE